MSGGHFQAFSVYSLNEVAAEIMVAIAREKFRGCQFSKETEKRLKKTAKNIVEVNKMIKRIDYLLSGDDSEEAFNRRWKEDGLK